MDITKKIDKLLQDEIVTGDVVNNNTKGNIDVFGGKCPDGMIYDKIKKVCVPKKNESSIVGGSYISVNTVNIIGSQQTRTGFTTKRNIIDLARKEPIKNKLDDPTKTNILGRKGLKFNKETGAYEPELWRENDKRK